MAKKKRKKKPKVVTQYYKGKHYFQSYLASLGTHFPFAPPSEAPEGKRFYRSAKIYMINAYEFKEYIIGKKISSGSDDMPFDKMWIEFNGYGLDSGVLDLWVWGCGFDKDTKTLHISASQGKEGAIEFLQINENQEMFLGAIQLFAQILSFLKPEFVNATTRSACIGHTMKNGKRIEHVSEYIHIYRKKPKAVSKDLGKYPVDWQHRWHQSGHWRKVKGIGKDADGNEVEGRTWIKSCVKGPEDKPLVNKIRLVKDSLPPSFKQLKGISA